MSRIKKVDELYKSTYISAADKLTGNHNDRANRLRDWAHEKGSPAKFDRDHPHRFYFSQYKQLHYNSDMNGYFSIVEIKRGNSSNYRSDICVYDVYFRSDYNKKIKIIVLLDSDPTWVELRLSLPYSKSDTEEWTSGGSFLFEKRKDAIEFKKYLHESISDDEGPFKDDEINVSLININRMYISNNLWYKK